MRCLIPDRIVAIRTSELDRAAAQLKITLANLKGLVPSCRQGDIACDILYFGALVRTLESKKLDSSTLGGVGDNRSLAGVGRIIASAAAEAERNIKSFGFKVAAEKDKSSMRTPQQARVLCGHLHSYTVTA